MARKKRGKRISKGVKRIIAFLEEKKVEYRTEVRFPECKDKRTLPFDFTIYVNDKIMAHIEYNGIQHYKAIRRWRGKKGLLKQQKHDAIKVAYCKEKCLPLLVIHYEEEKIEELCLDFLVECGTLKP